jgi:hypothetical protein
MPTSILLLQSNYNITKYPKWCISNLIYSARWWHSIYIGMNLTSSQMFKIPWLQDLLMHRPILGVMFEAYNLWPNIHISSNLQPWDMTSTYKGKTIIIGLGHNMVMTWGCDNIMKWDFLATQSLWTHLWTSFLFLVKHFLNWALDLKNVVVSYVGGSNVCTIS